MPQQPGHSRFRPEDLTTRPVSRFRDLGAMTAYVDYLLMRISEQREVVERKLVAFEALEGDQRARALREIKDNYKELLTGVIRREEEGGIFFVDDEEEGEDESEDEDEDESSSSSGKQ